MSDNNNIGSFFIGLTVGALIGAVTSLLLAPQSGEETRQVIKEKAIELKDKSVETYEETKRQAEIAYKDALAKAEELAKVTREKANEFGQTTKSKVETLLHKNEAFIPEVPEAPEA